MTPAEDESPQKATQREEDNTAPVPTATSKASAKRSLQQDEKVDGKAGGDSEAPPAKTLSGRRLTLKPKPNLEADRRPAAKPTPDERDRRPPDMATEESSGVLDVKASTMLRAPPFCITNGFQPVA